MPKESDYVCAYATAGGSDWAALHDSAGNDQFEGRPTYSELRDEGVSFSNRAEGFDFVFGYARAGGTDSATLYYSSGNDGFVGRPTYSQLSGTGFSNRVEGFDSVCGKANAGGTDWATLFGSIGNDTFEGRQTHSVFSGTGFSNRVEGFDFIGAYATLGGDDEAYLYDSDSDDYLYAEGNRVDSAYDGGPFCRFTISRTFAPLRRQVEPIRNESNRSTSSWKRWATGSTCSMRPLWIGPFAMRTTEYRGA